MRRRLALLAAVLGPGLLAGLSDDDPAGITTYSILGAEHGYRLLWLIGVSTAALIVFHELGARMGIATGQGLLGLIRERFGVRAAALALLMLVPANAGTIAAEFAGIAAGFGLAGVPRGVSVPVAAALVSLLVLRGSLHRVERVLLALSAVFAAYVVAAVLAGPDWGAAAEGLAVPSAPDSRAAWLLAAATVGTTLAPWGLAFVQSYVVDKRLQDRDLGYERVDVVSGAVMTGIIGVFVVVACAATLAPRGVQIEDARDAAQALEPLAGDLASALFGAGLVGAGLLAAAILPLSTAYSVAEVAGTESSLDAGWSQARGFYLTYLALVAAGALPVLVPGAPLVEILYLTQALNAILLLPLLVFMRRLGTDPEVMGHRALGRAGRIATAAAITLVGAAVAGLAVATALG